MQWNIRPVILNSFVHGWDVGESEDFTLRATMLLAELRQPSAPSHLAKKLT